VVRWEEELAKQAFVSAVSTDWGTRRWPPSALSAASTATALTDWSKRRLAADAEAVSDGLGCFRRSVELDHAHTNVAKRGRQTTTGVKGARRKYARCHLAEAACRFNPRLRLIEMLP
jgi:hypothetical protein